MPYPAANLYEATYLFALAVNETLEAGGDPTTEGIALSRRVWGRSFPSEFMNSPFYVIQSIKWGTMDTRNIYLVPCSQDKKIQFIL